MKVQFLVNKTTKKEFRVIEVDKCEQHDHSPGRDSQVHREVRQRHNQGLGLRSDNPR